MSGKISLLTCVMVALAASACSSTGQSAGNFGREETSTAVEDAIGLPRDRPGPVMVDEGDDTVPTPYGGEGSPRRCSTIARDVARLTVVLGADVEEAQRQQAEEDTQREGWISQGAQFASQAPELATDGAWGLYHSTIVGLNPVRPVIRFIGGAGRIETDARERREMAQRRRAYLRGIYDGFGCPAVQMRRAFEAYGLVEASN
ncbi:hypothetical protein [Maricaulis salignorans]|uniref:Uncharacterized protein n=1 Tax=Maricaulis salignorans TaxID=144026 RepID=A0A1G9PRV5_9PROT|nr:hypothetical protein [Maricaulis salignorans]SDM01504.1 hypothetical protein SAMN04488568_1047 [Maricaulis salignorans]